METLDMITATLKSLQSLYGHYGHCWQHNVQCIHQEHWNTTVTGGTSYGQGMKVKSCTPVQIPLMHNIILLNYAWLHYQQQCGLPIIIMHLHISVHFKIATCGPRHLYGVRRKCNSFPYEVYYPFPLACSILIHRVGMWITELYYKDIVIKSLQCKRHGESIILLWQKIAIVIGKWLLLV